jgi:hypothetical protein
VKALLRILYCIYSAAIRGTRYFLRMYSSSMRRDLAKMSDRWLAVNISTSQELYPLSMICISPQGSLHANAAERQSYNLGTCRQRYEILWFQCPVPTSISLLAWRWNAYLHGLSGGGNALAIHNGWHNGWKRCSWCYCIMWPDCTFKGFFFSRQSVGRRLDPMGGNRYDNPLFRDMYIRYSN